jgi:cysteinyl-tRNA synthetase
MRQWRNRLLLALVAVMAMAQTASDFATADKIRDGLAKLGVEIQDSAEGPKWKIKKQT